MELHTGALDDLTGWTSLRRDELTLVVHGDDETAGRVAGALDERRGEDVVDIVLDVLTADGFRATPDFALATPEGRVVVRGAGEVRLGEGVEPVVASPRMPWRDEDVPEGTEHVTVTVVGAPETVAAAEPEEPPAAEPEPEEPAAPAQPETPADPPAPAEAEAPAPAAPPASAGGWAMPSIFGGGGGTPPAPPSPTGPSVTQEPAAAAPEAERPNLTVVPSPEEAPTATPAPAPPQAATPAGTEEPPPVGEQPPAGPEAGASPSEPLPDQTETDEDLPSFDFLFGNTSHHRSSLIAEAEEQPEIDSGPVAAAGGFQAPEDAANATLAPPSEDHDEEHEEPQPAAPPPDEQEPAAQEPSPQGPGQAPPPPAPDLPGFTPPPATPAAAPPPPPAPQEGLISSVPWSDAAGAGQPERPAQPEPQQPGQDPAAQTPGQGSDPDPAHDSGQPGEPAQPHQAPFGVGLPSAMPSFGTPTASGPRPIQPAQEHDPFAADDSTGPMVLAVRCTEGHASAPHAVSCRVCGAALPAQQPEPTPRPSLGVLRMSTGDVVTLDRGVLIGRAPKSAPELPAAQAPHLVRVPSPDNEISRNHVEVILDGWHVLVRDLGSTNGTTITLPGDHPVRLRPGDQQSIEPGTTITLADQVSALFEVTG